MTPAVKLGRYASACVCDRRTPRPGLCPQPRPYGPGVELTHLQKGSVTDTRPCSRPSCDSKGLGSTGTHAPSQLHLSLYKESVMKKFLQLGRVLCAILAIKAGS